MTRQTFRGAGQAGAIRAPYSGHSADITLAHDAFLIASVHDVVAERDLRVASTVRNSVALFLLALGFMLGWLLHP